jgi:uncharacterized DUF497 family protein
LDRDLDWDPAKAEQNLLKHGIRFPNAIRVFADPNALIDPDRRFNDGEERNRIVGWIEGEGFIAVIYTERGGVTRIISAKRASRSERRKYRTRSVA